MYAINEGKESCFVQIYFLRFKLTSVLYHLLVIDEEIKYAGLTNWFPYSFFQVSEPRFSAEPIMICPFR